MTSYLILKSLHLVAMVAWFAGLFYLVRLFVYHVEAEQKPLAAKTVLQEQLGIMEERLFRIIMRPAMLATWIFGLALIYERGMDWFKVNHWLHLKLVLVFLLSGYSEHLGKIIKRLARGEKVMSAYQFRLFNEIPTLFLLAIILLAVFKNLVNFGYTFISILVLGVLLFFFARMYRKIRLQKK